MANIDETGLLLIENVKKAIGLDKSVANRDILIESAMNDFYCHFMQYDEERLRDNDLQIKLFAVERLLKNEYLPINTIPIYDEDENIIPNNEDEVLRYIVHSTRKMLSKYHNLQTDSLKSDCPRSSSYIENICSKLGIVTINICVNQNLNHGMFHQFTIVRLRLSDGTYKNYLVDCTYRQFFTKVDSNPRRIGVMRGPAKGCSIGSYMMLTDRRKEIAETILTKGYIELTPEVFKEYFDSIIYSGRDKEFYDQNSLDYMNPNDIIPSYSVDEYLQILFHNRVIDKVEFSILSNELTITDKKIAFNSF